MNVRTSEMVNLNLIQKSLNNSMFSEYISNLALTKILTERKGRLGVRIVNNGKFVRPESSKYVDSIILARF